ncbi:hypothetical protein Cgig2_009768 [Carnegiea gigantea]|uniref:Uncharacterized protein n=1 Tax=Carnegiea gigantea TaxID=171969 RepID=A0A9Q1JX55_9CARY|nr:hypothetical protein Cgig2_009768 [Carnegiea gigantea]
MKSSLGKLKRFAFQKNDGKDRKEFQRPPKVDELALASQEMQDMTNCYDSLLSAAAATANTAYEFSESLREMGNCLVEKAELYKDDDSNDITGTVSFGFTESSVFSVQKVRPHPKFLCVSNQGFETVKNIRCFKLSNLYKPPYTATSLNPQPLKLSSTSSLPPYLATVAITHCCCSLVVDTTDCVSQRSLLKSLVTTSFFEELKPEPVIFPYLVIGAMTLEQRINGIDDRIDGLDKKLEALQKGTNDDVLDLAKKWNARWDELRKSLQKGSKKIQQHIRGVKGQVQGFQCTIAGFQNSLRGIHGSVTKLEESLESHLSQYVHNVASSRNVQTGRPKLVGSVLKLSESLIGPLFQGGRNLKPLVTFLMVLGMMSTTMMNLMSRNLA